MNKEQIIANLKVVWPSIYRMINGFFFYLIRITRAAIAIAKEQIKGGING
ncbi:MAG: hypothetical protein QG600_730 [Patescibacteria group bacterium]|jgi:hypothetical protein|nr:hypothetical protein [Patescibacteria group bacterium]